MKKRRKKARKNEKKKEKKKEQVSEKFRIYFFIQGNKDQKKIHAPNFF